MRRFAMLLNIAAIVLAGILAVPAEAAVPVDLTWRKGTDGSFQGQGRAFPSCTGPAVKKPRGKTAVMQYRIKNKTNSPISATWTPQASEVIGSPNFVVKVLYDGLDVTADATDGNGFTIVGLAAQKRSKVITFKAKILPGASTGLKFGSAEATAPGGNVIDDCGPLNIKVKS